MRSVTSAKKKYPLSAETAVECLPTHIHIAHLDVTTTGTLQQKLNAFGIGSQHPCADVWQKQFRISLHTCWLRNCSPNHFWNRCHSELSSYAWSPITNCNCSHITCGICFIPSSPRMRGTELQSAGLSNNDGKSDSKEVQPQKYIRKTFRRMLTMCQSYADGKS